MFHPTCGTFSVAGPAGQPRAAARNDAEALAVRRLGAAFESHCMPTQMPKQRAAALERRRGWPRATPRSSDARRLEVADAWHDDAVGAVEIARASGTKIGADAANAFLTDVRFPAP